eukprot:142416-Rhodomonas_salina.2
MLQSTRNDRAWNAALARYASCYARPTRSPVPVPVLPRGCVLTSCVRLLPARYRRISRACARSQQATKWSGMSL